MKPLFQILRLMVLTSLIAMAQAQEVSIPDPVLNAAIRAALQIPARPLTAQDLLSLTYLNAEGRGVRSLGLRNGVASRHSTMCLNAGE